MAMHYPQRHTDEPLAERAESHTEYGKTQHIRIITVESVSSALFGLSSPLECGLSARMRFDTSGVGGILRL